MAPHDVDSLVTARFVLRPLTIERALDIVAGDTRPSEWADDYPTEGDTVIAGIVVAAGEAPPPPWCFYEVIEQGSGQVVGGVGFKGPPRSGAVEIGYGLAPSARGRGLATEAVAALQLVAVGDLAVVVVVADTDPGNGDSQRVLLRAGFTHAGEADGLVHFRWPTRAH